MRMDADILDSKVSDKALAVTNAGNLPFMAPIPSPDVRYAFSSNHH